MVKHNIDPKVKYKSHSAASQTAKSTVYCPGYGNVPVVHADEVRFYINDRLIYTYRPKH